MLYETVLSKEIPLVTIKRQNGAALFITLIFLLILTIIGLASMNDTVMQGKMAGAMQDSNVALQGVETAIRAAEAYIDGIATVGDFGAATTEGKGLYKEGTAKDPYDAATWNSDNSKAAGVVAGLAEQPRFFIELAGEVTSDDTALSLNQNTYAHESGSGTILGFRIVARSTGGTGTSQRVVESYYGKSF